MEIICKGFDLNEKLQILADAAKYDVACTSSGSNRRGKKGYLGNSVPDGICHSFSADGRCISLLKILLSNDCVYNCKYCAVRADNHCVRATFEPEEICTLVTEFYRRNYIEGLFLSSAVCKSPTYTMEAMYRTLLLLRTKYRFNGYIHVKVIPNAPDELIEQIGYLADRISINLELPTAESLRVLAPQKSRSSILLPMRQVQNRISAYRMAIGKKERMERFHGNHYLNDSIFQNSLTEFSPKASLAISDSHVPTDSAPSFADFPNNKAEKNQSRSPVTNSNPERAFAPAGQSTQMIIGASGENDYQILLTTQALYQQFDLKRVFFSAYIPLNEDPVLPDLHTAPPLLREHRLYQADWLLRYYGFHAEELLDPKRPNFNPYLDPKCDWALRHLEQFPVDVAVADYSTLMRVPGIGSKSALRILKARRQGPLHFDSLKKMGVVLKRAQYFILCNGRQLSSFRFDEAHITRQLISSTHRQSWEIAHPGSMHQMSLFENETFLSENPRSDPYDNFYLQR